MTPVDHTPHRPPPAGVAEHETSVLSPGEAVVVDSLSLLDHRTRAQMVPRKDAAPGRYLSIEDEQGAHLLPLTRPITHIGRGLVADVRFEDSHVSRRHAIVAVRGSAVRILDDRSTGGTFVNGQRVSMAELSDGDVVRVGRAVFRYTVIAAAPTRRVSRPSRRVPVSAMPRRRVNAQSLRRTAVG